MSFYQKATKFGLKFFSKNTFFKFGFNFSPMYRRSTGRVIYASEDLLEIKIKIPINYKNRNYMGSIFGGSMFSAVDPIPMVQLIQLLDHKYVVWDKSAEIKFKKPARENLYASFTYTVNELKHIKEKVALENEIEIVKTTLLTNKEETITFCEVAKKIYIADKAFFKNKKRKQNQVN